MNLNLRKILVIDVEATCWRDEEKHKYTSDIIQIGLSIIDTETLTIDKKPSIYVIPTQSEISQFCYDLTGINKRIIDEKGITFAEACKFLMEEYKSKNFVWSAVGEYDRQIFETQCERENVPYPFSQKYFNMKTHIALLNGWKKERGLKGMLEKFGLEMEGNQHDGGWDAYNSARILVRFLKQIRQNNYNN